MTGPSHRRLLGDFGFFVLGEASFLAFGLGAGVLLARVLGATDYGTFSTLSAAFWIAAQLGTLGLKRGVVRFAADHADERGALFRRAVALSAAGGALLGVLGLASAPLWTPLLLPRAPWAAWALLAVPAASAYLVLLAALQALGAMRTMVGLDRLVRPALRVCALAAAFGAGGAFAAALGVEVLLPVALAAAAALLLSQRQGPGTALPAGRTRGLLSWSLPLFWSDALAQVRQFVPLALLAALHGSREAGVYAVALSVLRLAQVPRLASGEIFLPWLARAQQAGDAAEVARLHRTASRWTLFLMALPTAVCVLFPEPVLGVFGPEYREGAAGLGAAAVLTTLGAITGTSAGVLTMGGRTRMLALNHLGALLLMTALCLWLVPSGGVEGALWACTVTWVVQDVVEGAQAWLFHRVSPGPRATLTLLAAGVLATGVVAWAPLPGGEAARAIGGTALLVLVYLALAVGLRGVSADDLGALRGLARRRG